LMGFEFRFTELGLNLLLMSYLPAFIFFREILKNNVPSGFVQGYGKVLVGKVVFAVILSILSAAEAVGPAKAMLPILSPLANIGGGYFIVSMIIDLIFIAILYKMEYLGAFRIVALNLLHIPFITSVGVLYAVLWEKRKTLKRVWRDLKSGNEGVLLGHAVWIVRRVKKPAVYPNDVNIRDSYDVRLLPARVPFRYSPNMRDNNNLNNHLIIAGASGAGKTTTVINLIKGLAGKYIVFVVDVKGDITQSLLNSNIRSYIVYVADVGVKVFDRLHEKERNKEIMEDLINSISVVERVGSRQAHFLRRALIELETSGQTLTYVGLLEVFRRLVTESLSPDSRLGPGTRDALIGIASKLEDLEEYFKDEGASISKIVGKIVEDGQKQASPVIVFNIEGMSETLRAVLLEFILRRLERFLSRRGPFAYLTEKTAVLIVDEAYLVTQSFRRFGKDERSGSILETISRAGRSYGAALILVTQRLCDISDGIRQNCERWVVFNTSSPEDARLLSIEGDLLTKLIPHLEKGYAYIRKPNMGGFEEIRYNAGVYTVTEGYIFEIARQHIQPNSSRDVEKTICYRCKLVTRDENICSFCNMPPLLHNGGNHTDGSGHEIQNLANSVRIDYEAVLKLALGKNSKYTKYLTNISVEHVKKFVSYIISRNDSRVDHELIDVGLLKYSGDGRVRLRPAGKLLHETLIELYGPDLLRRGLSGNNQQG
jgi:hypothetical protein